MEAVLDFLESMYYTQAILLAVTLVTTVIGLKKRKKNKTLKFFSLYSGLSALQILITFALLANNTRSIQLFNGISVYAFIIVELIVVYHFLFQIIRNHVFKRIMYCLMVIFLIVIVYSGFNSDFFAITPTFVSIVNAACIAIPCLFYF